MASAQLSAYTHGLQTHRQKHLRLVMTLIAICCTLQTKPLISTAERQKLDLDHDL